MADTELFGISEQLEKDHVADTGKMVGDLISKSAVLDEIHKYMEERDYTIGTLYDNICEMPSAQPSATDTNVATTDTISRQAAVSGISDLLMLELKGERLPTYNEVYRAIYDLPSAGLVAKDICVPVKDCISRQAALDALGERPVVWSDNDDYTLGARNQYDMDRLAIETVPSAQQWVPVTERLPEDCTDVLVWFEYFRYGDYNRLYQMHGIGTYSKKYDSWIINYETGWGKLRVFAWMPLPEPWKGEET